MTPLTRGRALFYAALAAGYLGWLLVSLGFLSHMATEYLFAPWRGESWVATLPRLNEPGLPSLGMYLHWWAGFTVMVLGFIQPLQPIRRRWPVVHRVSGNVYCMSAVLTSFGGLLFMWSSKERCVGGWNMNIAFSTYGIIMAVLAVVTWLHGRARRVERHRNWAIRLWGQGMASMLYRLWYMLLAVGGYPLDGEADFHRTLDSVLDWWFFLPNLVVAEAVIVWLGPMEPSAIAADGAKIALTEETGPASDEPDVEPELQESGGLRPLSSGAIQPISLAAPALR